MLTHTFHHIPGIGEKSENRLWASGVTGWNCLEALDTIKLPARKQDIITNAIRESIRHLEAENPSYFEQRLPAHLLWRFFPDFRHQTAYLDIETDGLDRYGGQITTIALYDGQSICWYVNGENLDRFVSDIRRYKVIVTYNGKCFDIPFIEEFFGIHMPHAHIDLRYILGSLGYRGGLKNCEIDLGIDRGELKGIDGRFAPLLWEDYRRNHNRKALETLIAYNIEDVINLETLMVMAFNMKLGNTPFSESDRIPLPEAPEIPFRADAKTVGKIKQSACSDIFY
ncbi:MAG: ribonuclease H-like domain-containing protein [Desulfobacterales bacterium]|nr:ribonuclease H-like domain-containing protein [Desulfobacterales bacterium]MDD4073522.1 ribonuclease H-like domain-containing protein [Desulfobacterales bacterium]MDD4391751.1 ribonuclease H-like domain-containing protein [Desulfobacterales bacterium]